MKYLFVVVGHFEDHEPDVYLLAAPNSDWALERAEEIAREQYGEESREFYVDCWDEVSEEVRALQEECK